MLIPWKRMVWSSVFFSLCMTSWYVRAEEGLPWGDSDLVEQSHFRESVLGESAMFISAGDDVDASRESYQWHLLPDGLLWRSYLAAPHEPRISTVLFQTNDEGIFWDATLGGRVGLLRWFFSDFSGKGEVRF